VSQLDPGLVPVKSIAVGDVYRRLSDLEARFDSETARLWADNEKLRSENAAIRKELASHKERLTGMRSGLLHLMDRERSYNAQRYQELAAQISSLVRGAKTKSLTFSELRGFLHIDAPTLTRAAKAACASDPDLEICFVAGSKKEKQICFGGDRCRQ